MIIAGGKADEALFWLSQPDIRTSLAEAREDVAAGRVYTEGQIRPEFGAPVRD